MKRFAHKLAYKVTSQEEADEVIAKLDVGCEGQIKGVTASHTEKILDLYAKHFN